MTVAAVPVLEHRNEVRLVGRVSADPVQTRLPSNDFVVSVRLVVDRPRPPAGRGRRQSADTLSCAAWTRELRRCVTRWSAGDIVEVEGALRRRFWRADGVPQSRYEIELTSARRLARHAAVETADAGDSPVD